MNTSTNSFDSLEHLIYENKLRISSIDFHKEFNIMLVLLNTGMVLKTFINNYPLLKNASESQLKNYRLIGGGTGIHWPKLDEDISLKGLLIAEFKTLVIAGNTTWALAV